MAAWRWLGFAFGRWLAPAQLLLAYGQTSKQETDASGEKEWSAPDKTTDKIQFESLGSIAPLAFWENLKLSVAHVKDVERIALVGDVFF